MTDTNILTEQEAWELGHLEGEITKAKQERELAIQQRDIAITEKDKALEEIKRLENENLTNRTYFTGVIRKIKERQNRPIAKPLIAVIVCAVLFFLAQIGVGTDLVSVLVGEPISYIALCCCSFFAGIVIDRTEQKKGCRR